MTGVLLVAATAFALGFLSAYRFHNWAARQARRK